LDAGRRHSVFSALGLGDVDGRSALWLLSMSVVLVIILLPFSSYVAALSFIQSEWGLNNTQAGTLFSVYLGGYAVSALLVIPLTDRLGPKHIFLGSAGLSVVVHALFPLLATGMVSGLVLRTVAGIGLVGVYMPGMRLVSERFASRGRGMGIGVYVTTYYIANSVSLVATGGLMAWLDWKDAYLVISLSAAVGLPLACALLHSHRHSSDRRTSGALDLGVLRDRATRYFMLGYSLHALELYAVRVWLPVFLTAVLIARGSDTAQAVVTGATIGGLALAVGSVGPAIGGVISDRWGRAASAAAVFALSGACSLVIGWMGDFDFPWIAIVALALVYGFSIAADSAIYTTAITEVSDPAHLGSTLAVHSFVGFSGGVVGPILIGGILDVSPESFKWGIGFSLLSLPAIIAVVALLRLGSARPSPAPPRETA